MIFNFDNYSYVIGEDCLIISDSLHNLKIIFSEKFDENYKFLEYFGFENYKIKEIFFKMKNSSDNYKKINLSESDTEEIMNIVHSILYN